MTWLDSTIAYFSPAAGLRRTRARLATQALLAYEGATAGRRAGNWIATGSSANAEIGSALASLRARSRDLVRNNPYAARAIDELVGQTIGTGIQAQAKTSSEGENKAIDSAWSEWIDECDADGQLDFYGLQDLVTRIVLESGECLVRFRPRFTEDGFRVPLQIQVIEPDLLDHSRTEKTDTGYIIQGVEFDLVGRRTAYWIFPEHPGEAVTITRSPNSASRRIPASQFVHVYRKRRAGQVRGVPLLAPVILALRDLDEYQDAERVRKKIEACLALFVSPPDGQDANPLGQTSTDETGARINEFRPGMIIYGRPGEKAEFFAPSGSGGHVEFVRQNERTIAAGIGLTYEQLTGDLSNVNYSSYRAGLLSFRKLVEAFQWLCLKPTFLQPIRRQFIDSAFTAGQIPNPFSYQTQWTPPAFGSVDPEKDSRAAQIDLQLGRATWPQVISEMGYDPREQIDEIEMWKSRLADAGVTFNSKGASDAGQSTPDRQNPQAA